MALTSHEFVRLDPFGKTSFARQARRLEQRVETAARKYDSYGRDDGERSQDIGPANTAPQTVSWTTHA